jgi:hypothetical protein
MFLKSFYILPKWNILNMVRISNQFGISIMMISISQIFVTIFPADIAQAQPKLDITKGNNTVWFGGGKLGALDIGFQDYGGQDIPGGLVNISAELNISPPNEKVFEGWLIDPIFNTYNNLSLGQFLNNRLNFDQYMMNPDLYEFFVVSIESIGDPDSRISNVIAGGTRVDLRPDATVVGVAQISSP